jgi:hypothetical protein
LKLTLTVGENLPIWISLAAAAAPNAYTVV